SGKSEAPVATLIADPRWLPWTRFTPQWLLKHRGYIPFSESLLREMSLEDLLATRTLPGRQGGVLPEARGLAGAFPHTEEWNDLMGRVYEYSEKWGDEFLVIGYRTDTALYSGYRDAAGFPFLFPTQRLRFVAHTHRGGVWQPSIGDMVMMSKLQ